jgi:hypothetical protein
MERGFGEDARKVRRIHGHLCGRSRPQADATGYTPNPNFNGEFDLMTNGGDSSYHALQLPVIGKAPHQFRINCGSADNTLNTRAGRF